MRVAILGPGSSPHVYRLAADLAKRGHETHVVSGDKFIPVAEPSGVEFHFYKSEQNFFSQARAVRQFLALLKPDVLHSHAVNHGGYLGMASGFHPHIMTAWGSDILVHPKRSALHRLETAVALRSAEHVLSDSRDIRDEMNRISRGLRKNTLLYWGADLQHFSPGEGAEFRARIGLGAEPFVLSPRLLTETYNQDVMIRAWPEVLRQVPNAKLGILRYLPIPEYEQKVKALADSLHVTPHVMFLEKLTFDELPKAYRASDLILSIPTSDGTPVTLMEALGCGAIVVACDLPALVDWVKEGETGFLVNPKDPAELAKKIVTGLQLSKHERLRMSAAGRALVERQGNRENYLASLEKIYRSTTATSGVHHATTLRNILGLNKE